MQGTRTPAGCGAGSLGPGKAGLGQSPSTPAPPSTLETVRGKNIKLPMSSARVLGLVFDEPE